MSNEYIDAICLVIIVKIKASNFVDKDIGSWGIQESLSLKRKYCLFMPSQYGKNFPMSKPQMADAIYSQTWYKVHFPSINSFLSHSAAELVRYQKTGYRTQNEILYQYDLASSRQMPIIMNRQ